MNYNFEEDYLNDVDIKTIESVFNPFKQYDKRDLALISFLIINPIDIEKVLELTVKSAGRIDFDSLEYPIRAKTLFKLYFLKRFIYKHKMLFPFRNKKTIEKMFTRRFEFIFFNKKVSYKKIVMYARAYKYKKLSGDEATEFINGLGLKSEETRRWYKGYSRYLNKARIPNE